MKHRLLICTTLILLAVLAAVIFDRAWLENRAGAYAPPVIFPPVAEAEAYFEETGAAARQRRRDKYSRRGAGK